MDDTSAPPIDLNIDPDMITTQGVSPQMSTPAPKPTTPPPAPKSVFDPGIIDITPGSKDVFPPIVPISNHIDNATFPSPKTIDITPNAPAPLVIHDMAEIPPSPTPPVFSQAAFAEPIPSPMPPKIETVPVTPSSADVQTQSIPPMPSLPVNPLAEDPDLVKLIK